MHHAGEAVAAATLHIGAAPNLPLEPWGVVRVLCTWLASTLGGDRVDKELRDRLARVGFELRAPSEVGHRRDENQWTIGPSLRARRRASIEVLGRLPNVALFRNPVLDALDAALRPLFTEVPAVRLVGRRADDLELESVLLLSRLLEHRAKGLSMALCDAVATPALHTASVLDELRRWDGFIGSEVVSADVEAPIPLSDPRTNYDSDTVLEAANGAFASYAFGTALFWAEELLKRQSSVPRAALIAGVSAHNLDPHAPGVAEVAARHFTTLLEHTDEPAQRAHALYRLCLFEAKTRNDLEAAAQYGARSLDEAARLEDGLVAYYSAWARNARAFVLYKSDRCGDAVAECQTAIHLLEGMRSEDPRVPTSEVEDTLSHLRANMDRARRKLAR